MFKIIIYLPLSEVAKDFRANSLMTLVPRGTSVLSVMKILSGDVLKLSIGPLSKVGMIYFLSLILSL